MAGERESSISSIPWRLIGSVLGIGGMLVLLMLALPKAENSAPRPVADGSQATDSQAAKCEQELTRIINALKPGGSATLAGQVEIVSQLNNWQGNCARDDAESQVAHDAELLGKLLGGQELDEVNRDKFTTQDTSHLRACLLAQEIVKSVALPEKVDRTRVVRLFEFVTESISPLQGDEAAQIALGPYESLLFGRGDTRHMAWTFAALLQQLRLDAVILRPKAEDKAGHWLIGVIVPRQGILLFDPQIGLLIPSLEKEEGGFWPTNPALISEARANDAVFRQFDSPQFKYPLTADDLKDLSVEVIGDPSGWSPRMAQLQFLLAAEFTVEFYDGLGANDLREKGIWDRVKAAGEEGGWTEDQMKIWKFPAEELARLEQMESTEGSPLAAMLQVFSGPIVQGIDKRSGVPRLGPIDHPLHETRMEQLIGNHAEAVENFVPIRGAGLNAQIPMNQVSGDYAKYWIGVSQFKLGRYEAALNTFKLYLDSHPSGGPWTRESVEWATRCLIALNMYREAGALLSNNLTQRTLVRDVWLLNRWGKLLGLSPAPAVPAETSEKKLPVESPPAGEGTSQPVPAETKTGTETETTRGEAGDRPPAPPVPMPAEKPTESAPPEKE